MPKFRKKPVVIEAMQYPGVTIDTVDQVLEFEGWFGANGGVGKYVGQHLHIKTLEE